MTTIEQNQYHHSKQRRRMKKEKKKQGGSGIIVLCLNTHSLEELSGTKRHDEVLGATFGATEPPCCNGCLTEPHDSGMGKKAIKR